MLRGLLGSLRAGGSRDETRGAAAGGCTEQRRGRREPTLDRRLLPFSLSPTPPVKRSRSVGSDRRRRGASGLSGGAPPDGGVVRVDDVRVLWLTAADGQR